jgi:hypothetical protein
MRDLAALANWTARGPEAAGSGPFRIALRCRRRDASRTGTRLTSGMARPCPRSLIRTTAWPAMADRLATGSSEARLRTAVALPFGSPRSRRPLHGGSAKADQHFTSDNRGGNRTRVSPRCKIEAARGPLHYAIVFRDCVLAREDAPETEACAEK